MSNARAVAIIGQIATVRDPLFVEDIGSLRALVETDHMLAFVTGAFNETPGDSTTGWFKRNDNDLTSPDDGMNTIIAVDGKRWVRLNINLALITASIAAAALSETNAANSAIASNNSAIASAASNAASGVSAANSAASAALASAASASASSATALAGSYPNSATLNVPRGLTQASVGAITAGAGGTNGTFAATWAGGNFLINPTANFTVAGGALTAFTITGPGLYIGGAPTVPTPGFGASAGLAGAAVVLTAQFLVTAGQGYWAQSADGFTLIKYNNVGGVATLDSANIHSVPTADLLNTTPTGSLYEFKDNAGIVLDAIMPDGTKISRQRPNFLDAPANMTIGGKSFQRALQDDMVTQFRLKNSIFADRAIAALETAYSVDTTIMSNALDGTAYTQVRLGTCVMHTDNQTVLFFGTGARTTANDFGLGDITLKRYTYDKATRAWTSLGPLQVWANGDTDPDGNANWGLPQSSVGAITPGAGGTNGTFALAWAGGNFGTNPIGTFTVAGGVLTAVTLTNPGLYAGNTPTAPTPSFAASAGLAGAAVVLTPALIGGRYLTPCCTVLTTGPNRGRIVTMALHRNTTGTVHRVFFKTSDDKGANWSSITEITSQLPLTTTNQAWNLYAPGPSSGIQLRNGPFAGRVVIPGWHGTPDYPNGAGSNELYPYIFRAALIYSDNLTTGGSTFSVGVQSPMNQIDGANECSIAEDWTGDICWNLREVALTTHGMFKVKDGGTALSSDFYTFQDANNVDITAFKTSSGMVQVAGIDQYNSSSPKIIVTYPNDSAVTQKMTASVSYDGGLTFAKSYLVTAGTAKNSVPVSLDSKTIGVAWEDGAFTSVHCTVINLTALLA